MIMNSSLLKNIYMEVQKLKEQAPPPPPPPAPTGAAPAAAAPAPGQPPAEDPNAPPAEGGEGEGGEEEEGGVPEGQPPVNSQDPAGAVFDYAKELAGKTINVDTILTGIKASIQSNFGGNYQAAWPIVQRLKDTENTILIDVANRLSLFITGTIKENLNKGSETMKISKKEIRELVHEAVKTNAKPKQKEVTLSSVQFENIVRNAVVRKLNEGALFDKRRSLISQERSAIENQLLTTEIREMAIDLFEKICQKAGLDADTLTPEAMKFVESELDRMITSAQEISNKLIQVAAVVKTAHGGTTKSEEGQG